MWDVTVGAYIFDQDISYREARYIWLPPPLGPDPFGVNLQRALGGDMDAENFGVFWTNDFHLGDAWTLTAGLRYTEEEKTAQIITGGCADNVTFNCSFIDLSGKWDNVTPKLGLQFRVNGTTQMYGFWTKGYRSGGFNFRNAKPNVIPPGPTNEEENNTFEVGLSWDIPIGESLLNLRASHGFRERHPYDDANNQYFDDQRRTNVSASWFSSDEVWKVSLYGTNLEDEANWGNLTSIAGLWTAGPMKPGRQLGVEINYSYE
jgi:outer membrane receptor protein involved in Fe transport